ncbi:MAG: response regulator [Nitrospirota bacterium]
MSKLFSETILLVDDEALLRQLVRSILQTHGYTVLEASGGMDAIRICQRHEGPIHLLLTDVLMPGMNGQNLTEHVTALRPHARVLYMSGCADSTLLTLSERKTEIAFIQKPFTPDALTRKVRAILGATR